MTTTPEGPVPDLDRALRAMVAVVEAAPAARLGSSTPCAGWTVADVVEHVITGNLAVAGEAGPGAGPLADRVRRSADLAVTAFAAPGVLERPITVPFGTVPGMVALRLRMVEALAHGWDVAVSTGQPTDVLPDDLAEAALAFSGGVFAQRDRADLPFGSAVEIADDAPAIDRLAALLGHVDPR